MGVGEGEDRKVLLHKLEVLQSTWDAKDTSLKHGEHRLIMTWGEITYGRGGEGSGVSRARDNINETWSRRSS